MADFHHEAKPFCSMKWPNSATDVTSSKLPCVAWLGTKTSFAAGFRGHWKSLYRRLRTKFTQALTSTSVPSAYMMPGGPPLLTRTNGSSCCDAAFFTRWSFLRLVMWWVRMRAVKTHRDVVAILPIARGGSHDHVHTRNKRGSEIDTCSEVSLSCLTVKRRRLGDKPVCCALKMNYSVIGSWDLIGVCDGLQMLSTVICPAV